MDDPLTLRRRTLVQSHGRHSAGSRTLKTMTPPMTVMTIIAHPRAQLPWCRDVSPAAMAFKRDQATDCEAVTAGLLRAAGVTVAGVDIDELDPVLTTGQR